MIGIDIFSGAGGMSVGAGAAGVKIAYAIEVDKFAASTYSRNHPDTSVLVDDIRKIDSLPEIGRSSPVVLFGGPPCQGFSTSNQRTRTQDNQLNWLYKEFMRIVRLTKPDYVIFENVKGIVETAKGNFFSAIMQSFHEEGYQVDYGILNAVDFGVPQRRSRLFILAGLSRCPSLPKVVQTSVTTVCDALADLPKLENGSLLAEADYSSPPVSTYAKRMRGASLRCHNNHVTRNAPHIIERYRHIPQGGNWCNIPPSLMSNYKDRSRCHTGIYHRLRWDHPSVVIGNFRKNMLIHPSEDRGLSIREAARLQSFPDHYIFEGTVGAQQQQVGNAVPPLLAEAIFSSL